MEGLDEGSLGRRPSASVAWMAPAPAIMSPPCTAWLSWRSRFVQRQADFGAARGLIITKLELAAAYAG